MHLACPALIESFATNICAKYAFLASYKLFYYLNLLWYIKKNMNETHQNTLHFPWEITIVQFSYQGKKHHALIDLQNYYSYTYLDDQMRQNKFIWLALTLPFLELILIVPSLITYFKKQLSQHQVHLPFHLMMYPFMIFGMWFSALYGLFDPQRGMILFSQFEASARNVPEKLEDRPHPHEHFFGRLLMNEPLKPFYFIAPCLQPRKVINQDWLHHYSSGNPTSCPLFKHK